MSLIATISNISRCSLHDGPGLRTVVYFKGCSLGCKWCHNPEAISFKKEIMFLPEKCICCGKCVEVCPECYCINNGKIEFLRENCIGCGSCAEECPSGAVSIVGKDMTTEEVFAEIIKDAHYFKESGGGVTFSGGECLIQTNFTAEIAKNAKKANIHTAIESAFFVPYENIENVLPYIDCIFADLKIPDAKLHREYTGASNELIVENIRKMSLLHNNIIIRIPMIPGVNDTKESMKKFADIINTFASGVKQVELLKYNHMAGSKYRFLGKEYTEFATETQSDEKMDELCNCLKCNLLKRFNVYYIK